MSTCGNCGGKTHASDICERCEVEAGAAFRRAIGCESDKPPTMAEFDALIFGLETEPVTEELRALFTRAIESQRITTRCPSCGTQNLFVGAGGHLTCSLIGCKEPRVSVAIARAIERPAVDVGAAENRLREWVASLRAELETTSALLAQTAIERTAAIEARDGAIEQAITDRQTLRNLLAVIHRDGGHHTEAVGLVSSVADAHKEWAALRERAEKAEAELREATDNRAAVCDRLRAELTELRAERERLRAFVDDFAGEECEYKDGCPSFVPLNHYRCKPCAARAALAPSQPDASGGNG